MSRVVTIAKRFCGPPNSGNGGYSCGLVASPLIEASGGAVEATLKAPPPLDAPLTIEADGEAARMTAGDQVIGEAKRVAFDFPDWPAPTLDEAQAGEARYAGFKHHLFPRCFVCGPDRDERDGLRIFTGPYDGGGTVAAPWRPDETLGDEDGLTRAEFIWAALDCPSYFALGDTTIPALLGRMTAEIRRRPAVGETCIIAARETGRDGRKHYAQSALFGAGGEALAAADAIWIEMKS